MGVGGWRMCLCGGVGGGGARRFSCKTKGGLAKKIWEPLGYGATSGDPRSEGVRGWSGAAPVGMSSGCGLSGRDCADQSC